MTRTSSSTRSRHPLGIVTIFLVVIAAILVMYWIGTIAGAAQKCADGGGIIVRTLWGYDCIKEES